MKTPFLAIGMTIAVGLVGCQKSPPPEPASPADAASSVAQAAPLNDGPQVDAAREKALAAKEALFQQLSGRLMSVMQSEGPAAAIEVCSQEASSIAKSVGEQHGVTIGRTALKLRNPSNEPPDWVKPLIEDPPTEPLFVSLPDGHTGALLPIKLDVKCVICHGQADQIADDIKAQLAQRYPDDRATGFQAGDLRGWFWVDVP